MQYENLLAGSPLIPEEIYIYYGIAVTLLFIFSLLWAKKNILKTLIVSFTIFHGLLIFIIFSSAFYFLKPMPQVIKTNYRFFDNPAIEIAFDKPVMRKSLNKSIMPEISGIWIFEDPIYDTHLYRKIIFYPYNKFYPGTKYTVNLSGIRNFLNNQENSYSYEFKIPDSFDILGETTKDEFAVIGSFPANGWDGINVDSTIRIRFNKNVNKESTQSHFIMNPNVDGTFSWDGDTLIFSPLSNLDFATSYNITVVRGVENLSGSLLNNSYTASFKTQEKITKLIVPPYLQKYSLSCEAATLRMVLAYRGISVTEDALLSKIGFDPNGKRGNTWGNPYVGFVGSVRGKQMVNGYGVYWEPIARAANNYRYSKSFENWTLQKLTESIQKSTPVIVWISISGRTPIVWTTPSGDRIIAVPDEHTVVVVGFTGPPNNPTHLIVNDPLIGQAIWDRASFEKKWSSLSNSGVLVY